MFASNSGSMPAMSSWRRDALCDTKQDDTERTDCYHCKADTAKDHVRNAMCSALFRQRRRLSERGSDKSKQELQSFVIRFVEADYPLGIFLLHFVMKFGP